MGANSRHQQYIGATPIDLWFKLGIYDHSLT